MSFSIIFVLPSVSPISLSACSMLALSSSNTLFDRIDWGLLWFC
ncbi:hypothetical protein JCM19233_1883 [Vibrio astriarenae]|nr:hypothetical protein JCM19233_1883 [Vibrio sp. C7]